MNFELSLHLLRASFMSSESENRKWATEINWFFRRIILAHLIEAIADPHVIHLEALAKKPTASQTTSFCDPLQMLSAHVQRARWEICLLSKHHVVVESLSVGRTQLGINRDDSRIYFYESLNVFLQRGKIEKWWKSLCDDTEMKHFSQAPKHHNPSALAFACCSPRQTSERHGVKPESEKNDDGDEMARSEILASH